jgi:hypothetical protein
MFSKQVKSATANKGQWSNQDARINYTADSSWEVTPDHNPLRDIQQATERAQQDCGDPDRYAARHKPQAGQRTLHFESAAPTGTRRWTAEQEAQHPRDEAGDRDGVTVCGGGRMPAVRRRRGAAG